MITVEKVTREEIPEVKQLLSYVWKDTYGELYPPEVIEKITSVWHDSKALAEQAADPDTFFAVAKEEGKIVGLITARKIDDTTAFMSRLYIHPHYQRKGIGTQLMHTALNHLPSVKVLRLECEKQNDKACSFYLKQGFKVTKEKEEIIGGIAMKTVEMEKELNG